MIEEIITTANMYTQIKINFMLNNIQFIVEGLEENGGKFKVIKSHGSISFAHNILYSYGNNILCANFSGR